MAQPKRQFRTTLLIGATVAVLFVILVLGASNFFAMGALTWSLAPILSVMLGYFTFVPILVLGRRGILWGMGVLSALYIPFIALLCLGTGTMDTAFFIAVTFSTIGMAFLWTIVLAFWFFPRRPRIALAIIFFVAAIVSVTCTMAVQAVLPEYAVHLQGWQFLGIIVFVPLGAIFAGVEYVRSVQATRKEVDAAEKKARRKAARKGR